MLNFIVAAAAVAAGGSPPADRTWISVEDYPAALRQSGQAGLVEVQLTFDSEGRLDGCNVRKSSGTALLDATTCRILQRRARAKSGEPRVQTYQHTWVAPDRSDSNAVTRSVSKGSPPQAEGSQAEAVRIMNGYARCLARTRKNAVAQVLAMPLYAEEQKKAAYSMIKGEEGCKEHVKGELRFQPELLVSGMAEEAFLSAFSKADTVALVGSAAAFTPRNDVEDLALCVVRKNPLAARAVLSTSPSTSEESTAIAALVPALGPCVPAGLTVKFSKPSTRGLLAAALYLSARQPAAQAAPTSQ